MVPGTHTHTYIHTPPPLSLCGFHDRESNVIPISLSLSEPDSPPIGLTVVDTSPSTTTLSWSPPERANGVIQQYEVLYKNQSYVAVLNSSVPRVTLTGLMPFSYYNVSVRAYTRLGHGNHTSDTLTMLSGEDGESTHTHTQTYTHIQYIQTHTHTHHSPSGYPLVHAVKQDKYKHPLFDLLFHTHTN